MLDPILKRQFVLINIVLVIIIVGSLFSIRSLKKNYQGEIGKSLRTVNESSQSAYHFWVDGLKYDIEEVASQDILIELTEELMHYPPDSLLLVDSNVQLKLRDYLIPHLKAQNYFGFFIVSLKDYISYGSTRNSNIATKNLIANKHPELFDRVKNGEFVLVPPMITDVTIQNNIVLEQELTMFSAAPIKNYKGDVIAILTLRIDPFREFTKIAEVGRIGFSGETYGIDENGFMITKSRFEQSLEDLGLLQSGLQSILNLKITDPGGNLLDNFQPTASNHELPLTLAAKSVLNNETSLNITGYNDYRGVPVLGAWYWDEALHFGLITEIDADEALAPYYKTRNIILIMLLGTIILVLFLTYRIIKNARQNRKALEKINIQLEDKVKARTKELQELNATKDRFFSIIAHDLSSPFNYLLGMTDLLSESLDTMQPDRLKKLILKLNDSAQSAYDLLENLLIWARTQQKEIKMLQKANDLKGMVNLSIKPLLNIALEKNIDISNEIELVDKIFVDEYMITTVIRNLVNNAIKYTRKNGSIRIYAEKKDQEIIVSVKDNGVGMNEEVLSKLFKIGENVSTYGTNDETGTGLGLILCHEFIGKNNGRIWVESQEEVGSTFLFTVPIALIK